MPRIIMRLVVSAALVPILIGAFADAADTDKGHSFEVTLLSHIDMKIQDKMQKIGGDTVLRYTWKQRGKERTLSFDSAQVKATKDGKEMMNSFMSRAKFTDTKAGKTNEVSFEKAPDELKKMLRDSFSVPICKLQVDDNGRESKRDVVAGPGAKALVDNGMIANALLFHPPFPRAKKTWATPAEISMGNGGFAKGELTYSKIAGGKGGQAVKVSGTLTKKAFSPPGSPVAFENAKYVVNGEQTYDPIQHEWVSGKLVIDVSFALTVAGKPLATAKGTMIVSLKQLPSKK